MVRAHSCTVLENVTGVCEGATTRQIGALSKNGDRFLAAFYAASYEEFGIRNSKLDFR